MALFNWSDQYSVGVSRMDDHHRQIFDIVNRLHATMKEGKAKEAIGPLMDELIEFTEFHFREEEVLMDKIKYPALLAQKQAHQQFVSQLQAFKQEMNEGQNTLVAIKVSKMATDWLKDHILKMDKKYEEHMKANGIS